MDLSIKSYIELLENFYLSFSRDRFKEVIFFPSIQILDPNISQLKTWHLSESHGLAS